MRTSSAFNQQHAVGFTAKPAPTTDSWWLGLPPEKFYAEAARRHPELARKYGSAPVTTIGPKDPTWGERVRRRRESERDKIERMSA